MATISRIRKHFWLMVVLMALALGGFMLMDYSSGRYGQGDRETVGVVDGTKISWNDMQNGERVLYQGQTGDYLGRRASLWNYFVEKAVVENKAEKLGLGVCPLELEELQFSQNEANLSDIIKTRFTDQQSRRLIRERLDEIKQLIDTDQLNPEYKGFWRYQQDEIIKDRLQKKMQSMLAKAVYTPTWMSEVLAEDQNKKADIAYVKIPFGAIPDEQVEMTDADYQSYIDDNRGSYLQDEPTRKLAYVVYDIMPTGKDSLDIQSRLVEMKQKFIESSSDSLFVIGNGGEWDATYLKKAQLPAPVSDALLTAPVGTIVGPYLDGSNYSLSKVINRKVIPDSVKSRHILIKATDQAGFFSAVNTIDSLKKVIEGGTATFSELASRFGQDATMTKGGDLGYAGPNQMVKPFNDLIFFSAEKGKLYTVATQFGYHLVEVTGFKYTSNEMGAQVATVSKLIVPSEATQDKAQELANQFAREHTTVEEMEAAAANNPMLKFFKSPLVKANDYFINGLGSDETTREFVKWAFEDNRDMGEVNSNIYLFRAPAGFYYNKAVVGGVVAKAKKGLPSVDVLKDEIHSLAFMQKKGRMIKEQIAAGSSLFDVTSKFNSSLDTARSIAYSGSFVQGIGQEPKLVGSIFDTPENTVSEPIVGAGGVFVFSVLAHQQADVPVSTDVLRKQQSSIVASQIQSSLMKSLIQKAKVKDNRKTFY